MITFIFFTILIIGIFHFIGELVDSDYRQKNDDIRAHDVQHFRELYF